MRPSAGLPHLASGVKSAHAARAGRCAMRHRETLVWGLSAGLFWCVLAVACGEHASGSAAAGAGGDGAGGARAPDDAAVGGAKAAYTPCVYAGAEEGLRYVELPSVGDAAVGMPWLWVSGDGGTVVMSVGSAADGYRHVFRWRPGTDFEDLTETTHGALTRVVATSCDGSVILGSSGDYGQPARFTDAEGAVPLAACGAEDAGIVADCDDACRVVVGTCGYAMSKTVASGAAARWDGDNPPVPLYQSQPDGDWTFASAVSGNGRTIAGEIASGSALHPFFWTSATGLKPAAPDGASPSMSRDGSTIVARGRDGMYRLRGGVLTALPCASTAPYCEVTSLSADGDVVLVDQGGEMMVWRGDQALEPLGDIVENLGVDLKQKKIVLARMTPDERVLVGTVNGDTPDAPANGFYMVLPPHAL